MSGIIIKEVKTKKDLNKFIDFANDLYKGNDCYVPTLRSDIKDMFNRDKNGAYEYCDSIGVLAYKDKKVVGRLMGIINYRYNEKMNVKHLRFTLYDVIDDFEVTKAMFDYIIKWGKEQGMTEINGPLGFTDIDKQDMLIEGYDKIGMSITNYNYPYYNEHMEKLGLVKDVDHVEYLIHVPEKLDARVERVQNALLNRFNFKLLKFNDKKKILPYIYQAFDIYNEAFNRLHGTVLLTERQIKNLIGQFIGLIDLDYVPIVVDKDDNVVGFAVLAPSLAKALQKNKGKLFPFGWYPMLKALKKNDTLEMYMIAIKPEYQGYGLNAILMHDITKVAIAKGVKYAETGPELEENYQVRSQWENYKSELIRKRRCYIGKI